MKQSINKKRRKLAGILFIVIPIVIYLIDSLMFNSGIIGGKPYSFLWIIIVVVMSITYFYAYQLIFFGVISGCYLLLNSKSTIKRAFIIFIGGMVGIIILINGLNYNSRGGYEDCQDYLRNMPAEEFAKLKESPCDPPPLTHMRWFFPPGAFDF